MSEFNWTCPFCQFAQTVITQKFHQHTQEFSVGTNSNGEYGMQVRAIGCSNPNCKEVTVTASLGKVRYGGGSYRLVHVMSSHKLKPESNAKALPSYVPKAIVEDYIEACRIRDLSPKASATLSRRCLQGIIRDYCGISKSRLIDEIETLRTEVENGKAAVGVTPQSVDAIDAVRSIGNIGAHMEKDINVIVDVDPEEAQALIELIEGLVEDWYVARNVRQERFARVGRIAEEKRIQKDEAVKQIAGSAVQEQ
jgi:hypothetical protein